MIAPFEEKYIDGIVRLWNKAAVQDGYKELDRQRFASVFLQNPGFCPQTAFVLDVDGVVGFACGCVGDSLPLGAQTGYITCILLAEEAKTDAHFAALLQKLEQSFIRLGRKQADVLFFNPIHLPWYIPDTPGHEHNNAPGAPVGSFFHESLLRHGYVERARECAMYLALSRFAMPPDILAKERAAGGLGYEIAFFDGARHHGLSELLAALKNPLWQREIPACAEQGVPFLVAALQGETVGFAGPVVREKTGRGYFTGIGVHPAHEGHGLGTALFFRLCEAFSRAGAAYLSLYTGETNPALRIYQKAGFVPARTFAVMRKELV